MNRQRIGPQIGPQRVPMSSQQLAQHRRSAQQRVGTSSPHRVRRQPSGLHHVLSNPRHVPLRLQGRRNGQRSVLRSALRRHPLQQNSSSKNNHHQRRKNRRRRTNRPAAKSAA